MSILSAYVFRLFSKKKMGKETRILINAPVASMHQSYRLYTIELLTHDEDPYSVYDDDDGIDNVILFFQLKKCQQNMFFFPYQFNSISFIDKPEYLLYEEILVKGGRFKLMKKETL